MPTKPSRTPEKEAWRNMHQRCTNLEYPQYYRYGGRGIKVCDRWGSFANFLTDMGERPAGLTLDRADNDGDYTPENCRWVDRKTQQRNTSRNMFVTLHGVTKSYMYWCEHYQINRKTVRKRIQLGWDIVACFETPVNLEYSRG